MQRVFFWNSLCLPEQCCHGWQNSGHECCHCVVSSCFPWENLQRFLLHGFTLPSANERRKETGKEGERADQSVRPTVNAVSSASLSTAQSREEEGNGLLRPKAADGAGPAVLPSDRQGAPRPAAGAALRRRPLHAPFLPPDLT